MTYKTTITRNSLWYKESKITVKYMLEGLSKSEINEKTSMENTYQVNTVTRSKNIANTTYNRMNIFSTNLLEEFLKTDIASAKIVVLISIMGTDQLFYEFMNEVFKEHKLLGDKKLTNKSYDKFIEHKKIESEKIAQWSDEIIKRIRRAFFTLLRDSGLLTVDNLFKDVYVDYNVQKILNEEGFQKFLEIIQ